MTFRSGDEVASPPKVMGIAAKRIPSPMGSFAVSVCPRQRICQSRIIDDASVVAYRGEFRGFEDY